MDKKKLIILVACLAVLLVACIIVAVVLMGNEPGKLPENPTELEKERFADYPKHGTLDAVIQYFDQYVEFSVERNAPVFCGEFGCFIPFIEHEQRVNWYSLVTGLLKERGIARTSWDYYGGFGIFNEVPGKKPRFPEDLNLDLLSALGLNTDL